jgi:hypothetical protein
MEESNMEINPQLTHGSVWELTKTGAQVVVLAVSNEGLSPGLLERFPNQVVYINASMQINTQPVEVFTKKRIYVGINQNVQALIEQLINPPQEEEEPQIDIDEIDPDAGEDGNALADLAAGFSEENSQADGEIPVFETPGWGGTLPLDESFVSYTESPGFNGDTQHILRFSLSDQLSLSQLEAAFGPGPGTIENFVVDSHEDRVEVPIDAYFGSFLEVDADANAIGVVYLSTPGKFRLSGSELDEAVAKAQAAIDTSVSSTDIPSVPQGTQTTQVSEPTHIIPQVQVASPVVTIS